MRCLLVALSAPVCAASVLDSLSSVRHALSRATADSNIAEQKSASSKVRGCSMDWLVVAHGLNASESAECVWQPLTRVCPRAGGTAQQRVCVPIEPVPPVAAFRKRKGHNEPISQIVMKGGLLDLEHSGFRSLVYVDLGANAYRTSIGSFFRTHYPHGAAFKVWAFEPSRNHQRSYAAARDDGVTLLQYAAWTSNTTLKFASYPGVGAYHIGRGHKIGKAGVPLDAPASTTEIAVPALDIADWLRRHVGEDDFVVVKCDIEGAEYSVLPHLLSVGHLIDEVFSEVHYFAANGLDLVRDKTVHDARALITSLRAAGVYAHAWN